MSLVDPSKTQIVMGDYGIMHARYLKDPELLSRVQDYRRTLGARMVPIAQDDIKKRVPPGEQHVSRKINGEFTMLVWNDGELFTLNPGATVRIGLPFAAEASSLLRASGLPRALVVGELYVERSDQKRPRVHDICQVSAKPQSPEEVSSMRFAVFDVVEPASPSFANTWSTVEQLFGNGKHIHPVGARWVKSPDEVAGFYQDYVLNGGGEGIVVRSDIAGLFKVKPKHTIDAAVVGFAEGTDDRRGMLHDMLLGLMRSDGAFHLLGRVGGGLSDDDRRGMLSDLKDMVVASDYAEVSSDHVAYQMVRPEWVVEISCLDVIATTTRGAPIERPVLRWDSQGVRWSIGGRLPLASVVSPVFTRRRHDKACQPDDVGLRQIRSIVPISEEASLADLQLPKSEVLRREVYTRVMKGQTMVRKLLLWRTNKEQASSQFPAYVLYATDFSPNRKSPLDREVRVSSSKEQIDGFWNQLAAEYFGKGWKRVS